MPKHSNNLWLGLKKHAEKSSHKPSIRWNFPIFTACPFRIGHHSGLSVTYLAGSNLYPCNPR
jgi:hypothetical protein